MHDLLYRLANRLYKTSPRAYRLLYRVYKRLTDGGEQASIRAILKPGMNVIDIGANIGEYSIFLANLVGPRGRVIAVEPEPENFARLSEAVKHLPRVEAIRAAASGIRGKLNLFLSEKLNVDHRVYDDGEGRHCLEVDAIALDDYIPVGLRVDFIKIDIQGGELSALKGAERILRDNHDIKILFEYWPFGLRRAGHEPSELISYLRGLGFTIRSLGITNDDWQRLGSGKYDYCNLIGERTLRDKPGVQPSSNTGFL
jgi:FkbM family methyltransferase